MNRPTTEQLLRLADFLDGDTEGPCLGEDEARRGAVWLCAAAADEIDADVDAAECGGAR